MSDAVLNRHRCGFAKYQFSLRDCGSAGVVIAALCLGGCHPQAGPSPSLPNVEQMVQREPLESVEIAAESAVAALPQLRDTSLSVKEAWRIENLGAPVGLAYDHEVGELRLAQIGGQGDAKDGDGVISRISHDGEVLEHSWAHGFDAPKGLILDGDTLWVTDIDLLWQVDQKTGAVRQRHQAPEGSFLVGGALVDGGRLLLGDLLSSRILSFNDGVFTTVADGPQLHSPTRLKTTENDLLMVTWGYTTDFSGENLGTVFRWNTETRTVTEMGLPMAGRWMGLSADGNEGWFLGDFETGTILQVHKTGNCERIITLERGLGDVLYLPGEKRLVVAHVIENRVMAFQLSATIAGTNRPHN